MKTTCTGSINIGPGTLEAIVIEGLKQRGMIAENAYAVMLNLQYKNFWGNQKEVYVNLAQITFKKTEKEQTSLVEG